jgi:hypothetical protein
MVFCIVKVGTPPMIHYNQLELSKTMMGKKIYTLHKYKGLLISGTVEVTANTTFTFKDGIIQSIDNIHGTVCFRGCSQTGLILASHGRFTKDDLRDSGILSGIRYMQMVLAGDLPCVS